MNYCEIDDQAYEDAIIYDGYDHVDSPCHITENNEKRVCTVAFSFLSIIFLGGIHSKEGCE